MIEELLSKNGLALIKIAKVIVTIPNGNRIPNVSELAEEIKAGRGTVQVALKKLQELEAIQLEARGHQGTYLVEKDLAKLWSIATFKTLTCAMPLPYSKRYEGLATGFHKVFEEIEMPFNLAYMRGAENRIKNLLNNRYDFILISQYAAKKAIEFDNNLEVLINFGEGSYTSSHTLLFNNKKFSEIEDGMKVGVDIASIDQSYLTDMVCEGKKVEYIYLPYTQILSNLQSGKIDACVFNSDEVEEKFHNFNQVSILTNEQTENTEAAVVILKKNKELFNNILEMVDVNKILTIQKEVMEGKRNPEY